MLIKRDAKAGGLVLLGVSNGLPENLLVAQVYAIKHSNGQANASTG